MDGVGRAPSVVTGEVTRVEVVVAASVGVGVGVTIVGVGTVLAGVTVVGARVGGGVRAATTACASTA